ncbi:MAG TPA: hypothetical protein VEW05_28355 [Candidatus Polarisedimenticolia bacterium]|nr:hypothetical protein [Candidatus Polarisedimenticolia bacterium]
MNRTSPRESIWSLSVCACFLLVMALVTSGAPQDKKVTQTAGVDNARMGAYRALAQLSFQAFQRGDNAAAAELARILERTWDQGEWHNSSESSFCKANRSVCQPIDQAMDVFMNPIMNYSKKVPDPTVVQAAYTDFLDKLKQVD